jgi:hypothetical protein
VTGSFGSLTAVGDERRCRLIVANVLIQFKIENGEVFADTMRVGCPRQSGDVSLLNKPPKHDLRNASPCSVGPDRVDPAPLPNSFDQFTHVSDPSFS